MKTPAIFLSAVLLAAAAPVFAQAPSATHVAKADQGTAQTVPGTGVIVAVDAAKGTVTIKHGPIAAIQWPAMTMAFKAEPPSLLKDIKVGERVNFRLRPAGMHSTVTAITPAQ